MRIVTNSYGFVKKFTSIFFQISPVFCPEVEVFRIFTPGKNSKYSRNTKNILYIRKTSINPNFGTKIFEKKSIFENILCFCDEYLEKKSDFFRSRSFRISKFPNTFGVRISRISNLSVRIEAKYSLRYGNIRPRVEVFAKVPSLVHSTYLSELFR